MHHPHPDPWLSRTGWQLHRQFFAVAMASLAVLAGANHAAAQAAEESLEDSQMLLQQFPFQPNCAGNTKEMVACLWQRRNRADTSLLRLLGTKDLLEQWRASRRQVCAHAAEKARGGSVHPIVWLSCENALNQELLRQIRRPLLQSSDL